MVRLGDLVEWRWDNNPWSREGWKHGVVTGTSHARHSIVIVGCVQINNQRILDRKNVRLVQRQFVSERVTRVLRR